MKLSKRLKELREMHNITQEEFYNDTGVNIGRIESGNNDPCISTLKRIADYFKLNLEDLFKGV